MSTERPNAPIDTVRDGQTFIKIWRNHLPSGDPIYASKVGYTYTDKQTGKPRDSYSLRDIDLAKMPDLSSRARASIRHFKDADRAHGQEHTQAVGNGHSQHTGGPRQDHVSQQQFKQSRQQPPPAQGHGYSHEP
ncbi:MAG: hypothetical protein AAF950_06855 [Pseudomonadota bacterium]